MDIPQDAVRHEERLSAPLLRRRTTWIITAQVWVTIGLVISVVEAVASGYPAQVAGRLIHVSLWWLVTILIIALADAVPILSERAYGAVAFHTFVTGAIAVLWTAAAYHLNVSIVPRYEGEGLRALLARGFVSSYFACLGIAAFAHAVRYVREHRAREVRSFRAAAHDNGARLRALEMQLQPHFLFNALNSVSALIRRDAAAANEMLVRLADLLRSTMADAHRHEVPLHKEIERLSSYVRIQRIRLGDRLLVDWEIDPSTVNAEVPNLLLQPLVENAIVHGIAGRAAGGTVGISARRAGPRLELVVRDDGRGIRGDSGVGIGIANTRARLEHLYGEHHEFSIGEAPGGGTIAFISIPFQFAPPDQPMPLPPPHPMRSGPEAAP